MSRFVVDLGAMRLSDPQKEAIAGAIQKAVLAELAAHAGAHAGAAAAAAAPAAALPSSYGLIPIKWRGLIYRPSLGDLGQAEDQIAAFANQQS